MSEEFKVCQSYQMNSTVCKDGFIQKPICWGSFGCTSCGRTSEKETPYCQMENLGPTFVMEDGKPNFTAWNTRAGEKA